MNEIIITVPHSYCLKEDIYKERHYCDFRAEESAKILKKSFKKKGFIVHYYVNKQYPRKTVDNVKGCDLNRLICRNHEWRKKITKQLKNNNRILALIDVHSYPHPINFGGSEVVILYDGNKKNKIPIDILDINSRINNILLKHQNYCNILYGKNNDIIDEGLKNGISSFLLEFLENNKRLTKTAIENVCDEIANYYANKYEINNGLELNGKNKKYKLVNS